LIEDDHGWSDWLKEERFRGVSGGKTVLFNGLSDIYEKFIRVAAISRPSKVLDVGGGDGQFAIQLLLNNKDNAHVTILDQSAGALEKAKKSSDSIGISDHLDFVNADMTRMPEIFTGKFDFAFSRAALLYADIELSVGEIYRSLASGGTYIGWEPVNQHHAYVDGGNFRGYSLLDVDDCLQKLNSSNSFVSHCAALENSLNIDAINIVKALEAAMFSEITVDVRFETLKAKRDWRSVYRTVPNPYTPSLADISYKVLSKEENKRLIYALQTACNEQYIRRRFCHAFVVARKW